MSQTIIFTDLDGTLLEHFTYSYQSAEPALKKIQQTSIPLIFCTSKTRAEIQFWQKKIGNTHPFISENGGGVFIPTHYFDFKYPYDKTDENHNILTLGLSFSQLKTYADTLKEKYDIISFADMSAEEISDDCGLPIDQAVLAKKRDFELPLKFLDDTQTNAILTDIKQMNLSVVSGGRYHHIMGKHTKGTAIKRLLQIFSKQHPDNYSIGIGDSNNDLPMLDVVDHPILVKRPDGTYISSKYHHASGIGPKGWNEAILSLL